jgi:hypothetical protein
MRVTLARLELISSPCVMPSPASVKVIVFAWSSVVTLIFSGTSGWKISAPEVCRNFSFSEASAALEISSRTKIS